MSKDEAMKLALEALENSVDLVSHEARNAEELYGKYPTRLARIQGLVALEVAHEKAITALREALAEQPKGRPVESDYASQVAYTRALEAYCDGLEQQPAQRTWVGLSDEAIWLEYQKFWPFHPAEEPTLAKDIAKFAKAIEAKLRSKNEDRN